MLPRLAVNSNFSSPAGVHCHGAHRLSFLLDRTVGSGLAGSRLLEKASLEPVHVPTCVGSPTLVSPRGGGLGSGEHLYLFLEVLPRAVFGPREGALPAVRLLLYQIALRW